MKKGEGGKGAGGTGQGEGGSGQGEEAYDDRDIDALFQLAPPQFVAARNALAAQLEKAGRGDAANHVKSLPKPSISAWTVNQVYWRHRVAFDKLLATGERFRQAQVARLGGGGPDIRGLLNERREALSEITRLAAALLQASSGRAPAGVMRRITATLEALSAYGQVAGAPRAGRLVEDVAPPGFESLAALVPRVGDSSPAGKPSRLLAFQKEAPAASARTSGARSDASKKEQQRRARLASARAARQKAERALVESRRVAKRAQEALKKAATRAKETEQDMVAVEQRLQKVASMAHEARQRARRAAVEAETAAQAVEEAELALTRARRDLDKLEKN